MLVLLGKLFRSILYIGIAMLIGWYNFEVNGIVGLVTNLVFCAIGILVTHTWLNPTKSVSVASSEPPSLIDPATAVNIAESLAKTAKTGTVEVSYPAGGGPATIDIYPNHRPS